MSLSSPTSLRAHLSVGFAKLDAAAKADVLGQATLAEAVQNLVERIHGQPTQVTTTRGDDLIPPRTLVIYDIGDWTNEDWRVLSPTGWPLNDTHSDRRRADDVVLGVVIISAANAEDWHHAATSARNPRERIYGIHHYNDARKPRKELVQSRREPLLVNSLSLSQVAPPSAREILTGSYPNTEIVEHYAPACVEAWLAARIREGHTRESAQVLLGLIASPTVLSTALASASSSASSSVSSRALSA